MLKGVGLGLAMVLVATMASAEDQRSLGPDAFRVSWQQETDPVARRIEGHVHNDSSFRVTDVRLEVRGLDAKSNVVGRTFPWAVGDIEPGGETSFVFDGMPDAISYRIVVVSYDVVSGSAAREFR
jgi:hypothetical protein